MTSPTQQVANITIPNAGFETPVLGPPGYAFAPAGSSWSWIGSQSGEIQGAPPLCDALAPEGAQVAFFQLTSGFSQSLGGFVVGARYELRFKAAQQYSYYDQDFDVSLDAVVLGRVRPPDNTYHDFAFGFTATQTTHVLKFQGVNTNAANGQPNTCTIDAVKVVALNLGAGLIHYWKLDEVGAGARADSVGSNAFSVVGTTTGAANSGRVGSSYDANGASYLQGANVDLSNKSFTIAGWLQAYGLDVGYSDRAILLSQGNQGALDFTIGYGQSTGGVFAIELGPSYGGSYVGVVAPLDVTGAVWVFLCARYDLATQTMRFRMNGTDAAPWVGAPPRGNDGNPLFVGSLLYQSLNFQCRSRFDEIAIWDRSLSDAEVTSFFTAFGLPISAAPRALSVGFFGH